jgi:rRNA-processing protein FCF1
MDTVVRFRLSAAEKAELVESADHAGLTLSDYIRRRALGHAVIARTDAALIRELRRQGGLVKHYANVKGGTHESAEAFRAIVQLIERVSQ